MLVAFSSVVVITETFAVVPVASVVVFSPSVTVVRGVFDVVCDASLDVLSTVVRRVSEELDVKPGIVVVDPVGFGEMLVVLSTVVTFAGGVSEVSDVEPGSVVFVNPVVDGEFAVEDAAVPDVVEVAVVVVTGLDMTLSKEVDVPFSEFVPSELDIVLFAVVDESVVVSSFVSVGMVCVADIMVSVVISVDADELDPMLVASVVENVVWVDADVDVDALIDIPLNVVISSIAAVLVAFSAPVGVIAGSLSGLAVPTVEVTFSVVVLSCVPF